jgi:arginine decarboxylase
VTPYPPGFPVLVPGQVFSKQILSFMRSLDTPEIHGYRAESGYRVYVEKALEIAATNRSEPLRAIPNISADGTQGDSSHGDGAPAQRKVKDASV